MTPKGLIRIGDLLKAFTEYYPQELLNTLHCEIKQYDQLSNTWIASLIQRNSQVYHPLYHILVIHFLDSTLERFHKQDNTLPSPFGNGPWPCLNPVCVYYQQRRIFTYQIKEVLVKGRVTGEFTCTCGYTYVRSGPDLTNNDTFRKGKVVSDGPIWEEKLSELWIDTNVSLKSLAHYLGVDPVTAKRHAALLNFPPRRNSTNTSPKMKLPANNKKDRSWYRTQWLAFLQEVKDEPLFVLKGKATGYYSWLVRNDKDWLAIHRPVQRKRLKTPTSLARADQQNQIFMHRDTLLAEAIKVAAHNLINSPGRPVKVSRNKITLEVPEVRQLRVGLKSMPLATQALQEVVETREGLALRRIKWTIERYVEEQSCPAQWKFLERAGLKVRILQLKIVQNAFENAMNTLSQFT